MANPTQSETFRFAADTFMLNTREVRACLVQDQTEVETLMSDYLKAHTGELRDELEASGNSFKKVVEIQSKVFLTLIDRGLLTRAIDFTPAAQAELASLRKKSGYVAQNVVEPEAAKEEPVEEGYVQTAAEKEQALDNEFIRLYNSDHVSLRRRCRLNPSDTARLNRLIDAGRL